METCEVMDKFVVICQQHRKRIQGVSQKALLFQVEYLKWNQKNGICSRHSGIGGRGRTSEGLIKLTLTQDYNGTLPMETLKVTSVTGDWENSVITGSQELEWLSSVTLRPTCLCWHGLELSGENNYNKKENLTIYKKSIGEGNDTPLQSSCLENPMDGGAW